MSVTPLPPVSHPAQPREWWVFPGTVGIPLQEGGDGVFGIAGLICFGQEDSAQALGEAAIWMQRCLAPDAARRGMWQQGHGALVFAGPVDGPKEAQPMRMAHGAQEWVLAYDGPERVRDVLEGFVEWNDAWISALDGPFTLALWQPGIDQVLIARSLGGEKPLYCARISNGLAFASDEAAIHCLSDWTRVAQPQPLPAGYIARMSREAPQLTLHPIEAGESE